MSGKYLAIFVLPKPQPEHARLRQYIAEISDGDYEKAFIADHCIGYLFTSSLQANEMDFSTMTLRTDQFLVVALGDGFKQEGLGLANTWLWNHRSRR